MGSFVVITKGVFEQERRNGRVVMGYLLGIAIMAYWADNFLKYALEVGEPVNIFETFCVVEQNYVNMLFLILGWLLVIADTPFMKGNTCFVLYRCGRRKWNAGMLLYLFMQAFFYTMCMAFFTVMLSSFRGFCGNIWSSPAYSLAIDFGNNIGVKYNITFPQIMMMKTMTVPQAFAVTFLFMYLYLVFLGTLLYVCNLLLPGILGVVITLGVHLLGYLQMQDGNVRFSPLAWAVPGNFIDGTLKYWRIPVSFLGLIAIFVLLSVIFVKKVDFKAGTEVDIR